jgi:hypothetical protein
MSSQAHEKKVETRCSSGIEVRLGMAKGARSRSEETKNMRIAAFILAILGGLAAAALGMTWLSDAAELSDQVEQAGTSGALDGIVTAGWLLVVGLVLGIVGGVLALMRKGKVAAGLLVGAAVAPAVFEPQALVFTFLLLLAGLFAVAIKPKASPLAA